MKIHFREINGFNLESGSSGTGTQRVIIFRSETSELDIMRVYKTNILIIGQAAKAELKKLLQQHGRPYLNKEQVIDGGISSRTMTLLRRYLEL